MLIVTEVKNRLFNTYIFFNTDFSFTVHNMHLKLYGYVQNVLVEGSISQNFDLRPSFIFMIKNVKNSERIPLQILYKT